MKTYETQSATGKIMKDKVWPAVFLAVLVGGIWFAATTVETLRKDTRFKNHTSGGYASETLSSLPGSRPASRARIEAKVDAPWKLPFRLPAMLAGDDWESLSKDPKARLEIAKRDSGDDADLLVRLIAGWTSLDPAAARAWIDQEMEASRGSHMIRSDLLSGFAAGLLVRSGGDRELNAFLKETEDESKFPGLPGKFRGEGLMYYVIESTAYEETGDGALRYLQQHSGDGFLLTRFAMSMETIDHKLRALDYLAVKSNVSMDFYYADIADAMEDEPVTVADWMLLRHPDQMQQLLANWNLIDSSSAPDDWVKASLASEAMKQEMQASLARIRSTRGSTAEGTPSANGE